MAGFVLPHATEVAFLWGPPTQDTGRCSRPTGCLFGVLQAGGIRRANGTTAMAVAPRVCV